MKAGLENDGILRDQQCGIQRSGLTIGRDEPCPVLVFRERAGQDDAVVEDFFAQLIARCIVEINDALHFLRFLPITGLGFRDEV